MIFADEIWFRKMISNGGNAKTIMSSTTAVQEHKVIQVLELLEIFQSATKIFIIRFFLQTCCVKKVCYMSEMSEYCKKNEIGK